jgi:hypothetical protein
MGMPTLKPVGVLKSLGRGLITGGADADPSGSPLTAKSVPSSDTDSPLMVVIQPVAARIGCVAGRGIAPKLPHHYFCF